MTRYSTFFGLVSALAFGIAVPAFADSQLAASAGLTADEAATMSLTEIAAVKFNRETRGDDQQTVKHASGATMASRSTPASGSSHSQLAANAGLSPAEAEGMTLTEIAAVKFNHETRGDDQQTVKHVSGVTVASRSVGSPSQAFAQLIASAGLSPSKADGMSLTEIAAYKFDRDVSGADRQTNSR